MSASGIRMGRVYVEIGADQKLLDKAISNIHRQITDLGKSLQSIGSRMSFVGSSAVTAFVGATKMFANAGDALRDMSLRTGASVEALSSLGYVADQSGADLGTLEGGMRRIAKVLDAARGGNQAAAAAFTSLGISLDELSALSPDEQLLRIGDALAAIPDPTARAAAAMKIFGKSGAALLPMLREGSVRIKEMQAEAQRLGLVMSTEDANAADEFNDALAKLKYVIAGSANAIGASLAPALTGMATALSEGIGQVVRFIRDNQDMVRIALVASAALAAAGAATWTLGTALVAASRSFDMASQAASVLLGPVRLLSNLGTALTQSFLVATSAVINFGIGAAVSMAGVLGPIGLLGVAIAGIGVAVAAQMGAFDGLLQKAEDSLTPISGIAGQVGQSIATTFQQMVANATVVFGDLWDIASTTLQGVADAMAAGDIAGAAEILWLGVQAAWQRGSAAIMGAMDQFVTDIQNAWTQLSTGAANATDSLWSVVQQGFNLGVAAIAGIVDNFVTATMNKFDELVAAIQKSWNYVQSFFREGFDLEAENKKVDNATAARRRDRELNNPGMAAGMQAADEQNAGIRADAQARADARNAAADMAQQQRDQANRDRAKQRQAAVADTEDAMKRKADELADNRAEIDRQKMADRERLGNKVDALGAPTATKSEVAGSFSAAAVGQMSFGKSLAQQQLDQLRRIADGVDNLDPALVGD